MRVRVRYVAAEASGVTVKESEVEGRPSNRLWVWVDKLGKICTSITQVWFIIVLKSMEISQVGIKWFYPVSVLSSEAVINQAQGCVAFLFDAVKDRERIQQEDVLLLICMCPCDFVFEQKSRLWPTTDSQTSWQTSCSPIIVEWEKPWICLVFVLRCLCSVTPSSDKERLSPLALSFSGQSPSQWDTR